MRKGKASIWIVLIFLFVIGTSYLVGPQQERYGKIADVVYGENSDMQTLDLYVPKHRDDEKMPVILHVHGGGWTGGNKEYVSSKPAYFNKHGYVFVSVNHRLSPEVTYDKMAEDVAAAIEWVYRHADEYDIDTSKINIMGHSAGGHLISLIGTNPVYLEQRGLALEDINSMINIDGPVDLESFLTWLEQFQAVFGQDERIWAEASPLTYANRAHLPPVLLVTRRAASVAVYADRINQAGNTAIIYESPALSHSDINKLLGDENAQQEAVKLTDAVLTFLHTYN